MEPRNRRFLTIDDLTHMPKPKWMIDGVFEANSIVMVAGPPASYKSFLCLDWMLCMATGRQWMGKATTPAKVLYVLGEGKASLLKRIQAWTNHYNVHGDGIDKLRENLRVTFEVPQMASKPSVDNMLSGLADEGFVPTVVIVDTFARSFVGMDENSQQDTGLWIEQAERLRNMGMTVIFLHHTARNTEFGVRYRGSSAILGAVDTAMTMVKQGKKHFTKIILSCSKQKDHEDFGDMYFRPMSINLDTKSDDSDACVLVPQILIDEEFDPNTKKDNEMIRELVENPAFKNDTARGEVIVEQFGLNIGAAKQRISRWRKDNGKPVTEQSVTRKVVLQP